MSYFVFASLAVLACSGCNAFVGNDGASLWEPDAGSLGSVDATVQGATPLTDAAPSAPPTGIARQLLSDYAGTCLDVGSMGQSDASLSLTLCADLPEQLIVFRTAEGAAAKTYTLFNPQSGWCVSGTPSDGGTGNVNGTPLTLQPCSGAAEQSFHVEGSSGAFFFVLPGNYCIDDEGFAGANGATAHLWGCNGGANQQWAVVP